MKLLAISIALFTATSAHAKCSPSLAMAYDLARSGMTPEVQLLQDGGATSIVQIWSDPETEKWTIIRIKPEGQSCILEAGHGFVRIRKGEGV